MSFDPPEDNEFVLTEADFQEFERALGVDLNDDARRDLATQCNAYLNDIAADRSWQTYRDVRGLLPRYEAAAKALWQLAFERDERSHAQQELDEMITTHLKPIDVRLERGDLLYMEPGANEWTPFDDKFEAPKGGYSLSIDLATLERLAMALRVAVNLARTEIDHRDKPASDTATPPTDLLYRGLRQWAEKYRLPVSEYIDGRIPAPFAHFVAALMNRVPDNWWVGKRDTTPGAVASQIKRSRTRPKAKA